VAAQPALAGSSAAASWGSFCSGMGFFEAAFPLAERGQAVPGGDRTDPATHTLGFAGGFTALPAP